MEETQCEALRRGKILASGKNTSLEKERAPSKVTPRKIGVGLKRRGSQKTRVRAEG